MFVFGLIFGILLGIAFVVCCAVSYLAGVGIEDFDDLVSKLKGRRKPKYYARYNGYEKDQIEFEKEDEKDGDGE